MNGYTAQLRIDSARLRERSVRLREYSRELRSNPWNADHRVQALAVVATRGLQFVNMTTGFPCSSPSCNDQAAWAVLSETPREGPQDEWGIWPYVGSLACDGHRDAAEDEAIAKEKHYRLIPIPLDA